MAFKNSNKEVTMEIIPDFDFILEESGNSSINLRKVGWNGRDPKIDIRKWSYLEPGEERALKGISLTDNAANELATVLVEQGYGYTRRIAKALEKRDPSDMDEEDVLEKEEFYDAKSLIS